MKRILTFSLLSCAVVLTGCSSTRNGAENRPGHPASGSRYGYQGDYVSDQALVETGPTVTETVQQTPPSSQVTPQTANQRQTVEVKPTTPPPSRKDYIYAKPVPGKPGHVFSPYAPNSGIVDVRGYESGEMVVDPYTQKYFLVP